MRFSLRDIAKHAPQKIKSQQSLTRKRFYRDARIRLQLAEVTYTLRLRASDSRQIESAEQSLSHWFTYTVRDSFKALLAGFEFAKANCCKSTSNEQLFSFCVWSNHASEFWTEIAWSQRKRKTKYKEYNWAANFVKTCNENARWKMKHYKTLEITQKSLFTLHHSELAWMEQSQAGINAHNLFLNSVIYP